jgi:hypothetical protein
MIGESTRNVKKNFLAYRILSQEEGARNVTDTGHGIWRFKRVVYVIPVWHNTSRLFKHDYNLYGGRG